MKYKFKSAFISFGIIASSFMPTTWADAKEDANYISDRLASNDVIAVQLEAIRGVLTPTIQVQLEQNGIKLSPSSLRLFTDLFIEEFSIVFIDEYRKTTALTYLEHLSPKELSDFRIFLESESGRAFADKQADLLRTLSKKGEMVGMMAGQQAAPRIQKRLNSDEDLGFSKSELAALRQLP